MTLAFSTLDAAEALMRLAVPLYMLTVIFYVYWRLTRPRERRAMPPFGTKLQRDEKRGPTVEWKEHPGLAATVLTPGRINTEIRDAYGYVRIVKTKDLQEFKGQE